MVMLLLPPSQSTMCPSEVFQPSCPPILKVTVDAQFDTSVKIQARQYLASLFGVQCSRRYNRGMTFEAFAWLSTPIPSW